MFRMELDEAIVAMEALEDLKFNFPDEFAEQEKALLTRLTEFVNSSLAANQATSSPVAGDLEVQ